MAKLGIEGKMLRIMKDICNSEERCVRVNVNLVVFLKQIWGVAGEHIVTYFFSLFLEDLETSLHEN